MAQVMIAPLWTARADDAEVITEIVVTSQRRESPRLLHAGNIDRLDGSTLARVQHQHIHELLTRVPGVWVVRASGHEHLTAIRSPVLTGAGSCGGFLFLEDGISIRPTGFCNVNQLFELGSEQAQTIEVLRGPGNALFGSNALHGIINVIMPTPGKPRAPHLALEVGANDFYRVRGQLPFSQQSPWLASLVYADDGGFRDDSGYRQGKIHVKHHAALDNGELTLALSATDLRQETAGFILGEDAYKDPAVNRSNLNPEAFRDASSLRIYGIWTPSFGRFDLDVRPYLRHSDMTFLQHFLPGQPLEENGHLSAGVITSASVASDRHDTVFGVDLEWSDMFLEETQVGPTQGSAFLQETRPEGKHYDYKVDSLSIAPFLQTEFRFNEQLRLAAGLRLEWLRYDYKNNMLVGNTRDDGSVCGFGGCLYTRPADRSDSYTNLAPKLSATYQVNRTTVVFANLARGFRAPQATELYRLQSGQQIADLDSERLDSLEVGVRTQSDSHLAEIAIYAMRKRNSIFRDAEGFNVSGGRTRHHGIEVGVDWQFGPAWTLNVDASYARHRYDFDVVAAQGETFVSGRDVDTAPRWLGSIELSYAPDAAWDVALQWTTIGAYYIEAENQFRYPGHALANLRLGVQLAPTLDVVLRLNNLSDERIADRADYAFGNYRYFPGRGRELFAEIRYSPD